MQEGGCVKERTTQDQPAAVPGQPGATQAGKTTVKAARRARWAWAQASVWTDRMLAALEYGVKGDVWFSLMDKVYNPDNLWSSWAQSAKNQGKPGVDGITIDRYEKDAEANLRRLSEQLRDGSYQPKEIRRTYIPKADGTMRASAPARGAKTHCGGWTGFSRADTGTWWTRTSRATSTRSRTTA